MTHLLWDCLKLLGQTSLSFLCKLVKFFDIPHKLFASFLTSLCTINHSPLQRPLILCPQDITPPGYFFFSWLLFSEGACSFVLKCWPLQSSTLHILFALNSPPRVPLQPHMCALAQLRPRSSSRPMSPGLLPLHIFQMSQILHKQAHHFPPLSPS